MIVSLPVFSVKRTELYRLGYVLCLYHVGVVKVGDGSCDAENAVVASARKPETLEGVLQQSLRGRFKGAVFPYLMRGERGI